MPIRFLIIVALLVLCGIGKSAQAQIKTTAAKDLRTVKAIGTLDFTRITSNKTEPWIVGRIQPFPTSGRISGVEVDNETQRYKKIGDDPIHIILDGEFLILQKINQENHLKSFQYEVHKPAFFTNGAVGFIHGLSDTFLPYSSESTVICMLQEKKMMYLSLIPDEWVQSIPSTLNSLQIGHGNKHGNKNVSTKSNADTPWLRLHHLRILVRSTNTFSIDLVKELPKTDPFELAASLNLILSHFPGSSSAILDYTTEEIARTDNSNELKGIALGIAAHRFFPHQRKRGEYIFLDIPTLAQYDDLFLLIENKILQMPQNPQRDASLSYIKEIKHIF